MILCLTGLPGSGKSTAAAIFEQFGFEVFEGSTAIKEEMKKHGVEITPSNIESFTNKMKTERGKAFFAAITGERVKEAGQDHDILVIGFRSVAEFEELERVLGSKIPLIVLTTPEGLRFERLSERKIMAIKSKDEFITRDRSNIGQGILKLIEKADYLISNTGSKDELEESILELLEKIGDNE
jgi:dephospho-CoA kinase